MIKHDYSKEHKPFATDYEETNILSPMEKIHSAEMDIYNILGAQLKKLEATQLANSVKNCY